MINTREDDYKYNIWKKKKKKKKRKKEKDKKEEEYEEEDGCVQRWVW